MANKVKDLGIIRERGRLVIYYFKEDPKDKFLCLWKTVPTNMICKNKNRKKEMVLKTDVKKDGNLLSWYYAKTNPDGTIAMWRTNRNFVPPGVSWGKARKTIKKEQEAKKFKSIKLRMTNGELKATLTSETNDGFVEKSINVEEIKNENNSGYT